MVLIVLKFEKKTKRFREIEDMTLHPSGFELFCVGQIPCMLSVFCKFGQGLACFTFRCGKTTVCQLYAAMKTKKLHSVNCHLHTESADFLGGLRPVRSHVRLLRCIHLFVVE